MPLYGSPLYGTATYSGGAAAPAPEPASGLFSLAVSSGVSASCPGPAAVNCVDRGDIVRLSATFTSLDDGSGADPTAVQLLVKTPDDVTTTYVFGSSAVTRDSAGVYYLDLTATLPGFHFYRWEGTGVVTGAGEAQFQVRLGRFYA